MSPTKITVLISGNGSNLQALINAANTPALPNTTIIRVISNKKTAYGLERAAKASIPTAYHNLVAGGYTKKFPNPVEGRSGAGAEARRVYDADLAKLVVGDEPDMVVCAGWMHIVSPAFLEPLAAASIPIINLHPALPGEFNGIDAIKRAFTDFQDRKSLPTQPRSTSSGNDGNKVARTGVMIHYVIQEVDEGQPIITREVDIKDDDTLDTLEERMHTAEHEVIVLGTRMAIESLVGGREGGLHGRRGGGM